MNSWWSSRWVAEWSPARYTGGNMMRWMSVNEVQARLPELVKQIASGDEVVITDHDEPVARLVRQEVERPLIRRPGSA
ncbi:MAG: type II toxin-antitoxin system Phd/YefM family antitoxin, partial [Chromatiaceae bacterium]|nr:type II toxin-antitoxin system Phd/YefM family antitoxin [Chromatiaceae bacterium]MBP8289882.1 type II toxin-antitoxin system Phd/YefM family antitoxin [Chromatiaceae bacterium]